MAESVSFRFNFGQTQVAEAVDEKQEDVADAEEVPFKSSEDYYDFEYQTVQGIQLMKGRITSDAAASALGDERVSSSDLVAGRYEGGFKLWECSLDLCLFLAKLYGLNEESVGKGETNGLTGKNVLELGCGHGLPGVLALLAGAAVDFQDYNREVLEKLTIPNVRHNFTSRPSLPEDSNVGSNAPRILAAAPQRRLRPPSRFFAGDWSRVGELLTVRGYGGHYDVILSAETIYNPQSARRLLESIKQLLHPPHGVAYVAAKKYYFGVGGGVEAFKKMVLEDGLFEVSDVAEVKEPTGGNVRLVLKMNFPESICPYFL